MNQKNHVPFSGMFGKRNVIAVGRAASGIYLILRRHFAGGKVLVPANICYAAIYPVIYAGMEPVFCDVDPSTGNMTPAEFARGSSAGIKAAIVPHMYGNPVRDMCEIANFCAVRGILLIEDCASAMGAEVDGRATGSFGDYVIYSTGYAKTLDLGLGGLIASDLPLGELVEEERTLPRYACDIGDLEKEFSKNYRLWRNSNTPMGRSPFSDYFWGRDFRRMFIFGIPQGLSEKIANAIQMRLEDEIAKRRAACAIYAKCLSDSGSHHLLSYPFAEGAVPWRWCVFVRAEIRRRVIDALLEHKVPVSDWYPSVVDLFHVEDRFDNARQMGESLLNFPLGLQEREIRSYVNLLVETTNKIEEETR